MKLGRKFISNIYILFFLFLCTNLFAQQTITIQNEKLLDIEVLKSTDYVFKEYQKIVSDNYKTIARKQHPEMLFFKHTITKEDKAVLHWQDSQLLAIASRCNVSYDTLATLNGISNSTEDLIGKTILVTTASGLFIKKDSLKCDNSLEILLRQNYADTTLTNQDFYYNINGEDYIFLENLRFTSTERAYFLDSVLGLPLDKDSFWISSEFGKRKNPVSGEWKDHKGIDLAANEGTPVYAIKDGNVAFCIEKDTTFGNYIILSHDLGKMTSVYAHLSSICVNQYDSVKKGDIIGYVGHTGMATGSHLHFEIRQGGVAQDPQTKLDLK